MRADHQPVSGLAGRQRQLVDRDSLAPNLPNTATEVTWQRRGVDRDALDATAVAALRVRRDDGEVDDVAHLLRQVLVDVVETFLRHIAPSRASVVYSELRS